MVAGEIEQWLSQVALRTRFLVSHFLVLEVSLFLRLGGVSLKG